MRLTLPDSVSSPQDVIELIDEIRSLARARAHQAILKRVKGAAADSAPLSKAASELFASLGLKSHEASELNEVADALQALQKTAPLITITLAAPATPDIKRILTAWFRKNTSPFALLRLQYNSAILGGLVVRFGSHIYDWSFRSEILNNADKFAGVLERV